MKVKIEIESDEDIQSANLVFTYKGDKVAVKSIELLNDNDNKNDTNNSIEPVDIKQPASIIVPNKSEPTIKDSFGTLEHKEGVDESFSRTF